MRGLRIAGGSAGVSADRRGHLARVGEPSQGSLGEDESAVDGNLEDTPSAPEQVRGGAELPLELRCQTGSTRLVVSHHAVLDGDVHGSPRHPVGAAPGATQW